MGTCLKVSRFWVLAMFFAAGIGGFDFHAGEVVSTQAGSALKDLALQAVAENPERVAVAIAALREAGPAGLEALWAGHADKIARLAHVDKATESMPEERRLIAALDAVARQKDALASRLYWYTDWPKAQAAAKASGKPILALRLLGNLDEDCSCANSRFFRTALYANGTVSKALRERFVLYWKSVRPVPKLTVDFGDGRTLVRTVTGNSIHYVLDAHGRPLDALPGLFGPRAFLNGLERAENLAEDCVQGASAEWDSLRRRHHGSRVLAIREAWAQDLTKLGIPLAVESEKAARLAALTEGSLPTAHEALPIAVKKLQLELPLVRAITPGAGSLESVTNASVWTRVAALHSEDARLDAGSKALMRAKHPSAYAAARLTETKARVEDPLVRAVRNFERSMAEDTVRNEYVLHRKIHEWFARGAVGVDAEALNERIYAELFLTPSSDPWLGLAPADAYSALEDGGVRLK